MDRVVICMKWGTLYGPDYVNVLYSACREYITGDFRFVCLTDDVTGIREEVETFPIPDMGLSEYDWKSGAWAKLSVFSADLYGLSGRALFVDLDTVLCGPMDPLFEVPGDIVVIDSSENWRDPDAGATPPCNDVRLRLHHRSAPGNPRAVPVGPRRHGREVHD